MAGLKRRRMEEAERARIAAMTGEAQAVPVAVPEPIVEPPIEVAPAEVVTDEPVEPIKDGPWHWPVDLPVVGNG